LQSIDAAGGWSWTPTQAASSDAGTQRQLPKSEFRSPVGILRQQRRQAIQDHCFTSFLLEETEKIRRESKLPDEKGRIS
jgi:hypothetical protein